MSDASSAVTYMSVYTDSEPWRYYRDNLAETGPSGVIVYGYDGLPIQPVAPPSLDYVPGPEHPPSLMKIPYLPEPEYPEYLAPSNDEAPLEDQPLPDDDDDDDDTNDEDPEEERFEMDDEEEEEHPAPANSPDVPIVDLVLSAKETEALEADEPTHAPGSPISIPFYQTRLRRARKTVRPEPPMACLTAPTLGFEIGESSAAGAVRQPGPTESDLRRRRVEQAGYGITDTWDEIMEKMMEIAPTTLEGVNERVTELDTTVRQRTDEFEGRSQVRVPPETFTPSGGIGGSKGRFRIQHTAQLDVTAGPEPLTTNKLF
uniref:Uncharacterized protein n=1 Tax=Tanacetum cinerariifolium TaxID=118510 RepID=A0A6L2KN99_TANCI|nr:hypothetical protein [Tanacetum cinerariifolium]